MKKLCTMALFLLGQLTIANAQTPPSPSTSVSPILLTGTVGVAFHKDYGFLNFGGPTVRVTHKHWGLNLSMLPSLMYKWQPNTDQTLVLGSTPQLIPNLGASISISYKRASTMMPIYYIVNRRIWVAAFGIGYRFGK